MGGEGWRGGMGIRLQLYLEYKTLISSYDMPSGYILRVEIILGIYSYLSICK